MSSSAKHLKKIKQAKRKAEKALKKAQKAKERAKDAHKAREAYKEREARKESDSHTTGAPRPMPGPADNIGKTRPAEKNHQPDEKFEKRDEADAASFMTTFDRQVLAGVFAEWELAWGRLPEVLRYRVRSPFFSIQDMTDRLGLWRADRREISLSRELVSQYRWDDVREVLLHEMAHQVAQEGLGGRYEPPHGESFKKACALLRITPMTGASYRPLRDRLGEGEILDEQDRIMVKIQKLMALSTSSNANEAHAAMQKAYELIARHNISLIETRRNQNYISIFIDVPRLRRFQEEYHLASLLQEFYFVHGIWVPAWVREKEKMGRVLEISGTRHNVQIAEYVYEAVVRYIDSSWEDYRRKMDLRLDRYRKTDFAMGIIQGFRTTLTTAAQNVTLGPDRLVPAVITDPGLEDYVGTRYPNTRRFSKRGPGCNEKILSDGVETGKKLVISKGISQTSDVRDLRLPEK